MAIHQRKEEKDMSTGTTILRLVNVEEVERYYLQSEMLKLAHKLGWEVGDGSVELLSRGELWPLSLAQSWFNQGYTGEFLGRADFEWFEATCPVSAITFVETDQSVDTTVSSVQHNVTPAEFETGVKRWRKEHRPDHEPLLLKHVIVRQRGDEILLLDGTHRFLRQVAEGADEVLCYYGRSTGKGKRLTVIGPQIRWLRDLWRTADDEGGGARGNTHHDQALGSNQPERRNGRRDFLDHVWT